MHRLPNGFGSIKKLTGVRRKPYAAYPPTIEYHPNGSPVSRQAIGYFETYADAMKALSEYNYHPIAERITFRECFEAYFEHKFNRGKKYSDGTKKTERGAFTRLSPLYEKEMQSINLEMLQDFVDNLPLRHAGTQMTVHVIREVFKYAEKNQYIRHNPSKFIAINKEDDDEHGVPFTASEIETLWKHKNDRIVQIVLAMIYTGFRVSALIDWQINMEDLTIYGGVKRGKRTVPIHSAIVPFVSGMKIDSVATFRYHFNFTMKQLGMDHTPHDTRHTFSWLCDTYGIDTISKHMLMGHTLGKDVEARYYSHRTMEQLREQIEKIRCH